MHGLVDASFLAKTIALGAAMLLDALFTGRDPRAWRSLGWAALGAGAVAAGIASALAALGALDPYLAATRRSAPRMTAGCSAARRCALAGWPLIAELVLH